MVRSWSARSPRTMNPPTAPQPKPSTESCIPVRPKTRNCIALCRRRDLAVAAGAHEPARHCTGVLAALEDRRPGDERRLVALDALDKAPAVGRHVVDQFGL